MRPQYWIVASLVGLLALLGTGNLSAEDDAEVVAEPSPAAESAETAVTGTTVAVETPEAEMEEGLNHQAEESQEAEQKTEKPSEAEALVAVSETPSEPQPTEAPPVAPAPKAQVETPAEEVPDIEAQLKALGGEERTKAADLLAQQEEVRRQARRLEGEKSLQQADAAFRRGDYAAALAHYRNARSKLPVSAATAEGRKRAEERIPECEFQVALGAYKAGNTQEALSKAKDALTRSPEHRGLQRLVARIEQEEAERRKREAVKLPAEVSASEVAQMMRRAKNYLAVRDYDRAKAEFESVLAVQPDNKEAIQYLKEIGDRRYVSSSQERSATVANMAAQVRDTWNPPQYKVVEAGPAEKPKITTTESAALQEKLARIIIPEIEFRQANIHDVVEFLNTAARENDKDEPDETKRGVSIILNLNPGGTAAPAPAAPAAGGDLFGAEAGGIAPGGGGQTYEITFTARYISLAQALKIITQVAGLRHIIEGSVVMIVPRDYEPGEIETRMYPVEPTFIERIREVGEAQREATRTVGGREVRTMEVSEIGTGLPDLKTYFEGMGVRWPRGSSITYNSAISKVIVANTSENLARFEKILQELNVVPKQVEIEARFVEVNQTDLQELGLEWLLTDNWELATKKGSSLTPLSARQRLQVNANAADGGFTRGLRFWDPGGSGTQLAQTGGTLGRVLSFSSVLTNPELNLILHALEQSGNADLLSAPKVTTRSGTEASIRVVTEYIYPTEFEVQGGQITAGGAGWNAGIVQETVVVPQTFQTREVGVILQVLPEVSPDGMTINLTLTPSVVTDPTWYQYGSTVRRADGSIQELNMPQPFFHVRTINTSISIYDGATVVMGGLIKEDVRKVNDRVPLLGDIPLLGVLFRSQSERSEKKNLLIFVTARLVDPSGRVIRQPAAEAAPAVPQG